MQKYSSADDAQVIYDGRDRLIEKLLAHQQRGSQYATDKEEDLRRKQNPRHVRTKRNLLRSEAVVSEANEGRGEEHEHDGGHSEHQRHKVEHDKQNTLTFGLFIALTIAVEDGDKGDGDGPSNQEVVHEVGQAKGGHVRIGMWTRAEEPGDVLASAKADDAR